MATRTGWVPRLQRGGEPLYRQIARALAGDIRSGRLAPGERLPPHRELAQVLSVTTSTVTKAYREVARLNLVGGRARAGTHVVQRADSVVGWRGARPDGGATLDLASNSVGIDRFLHELAASIPALSGTERFADLQEYPPVAGHPHHRHVIAQWLCARGIQAEPEQVVITSGAHHALAAVLATLAQHGTTLAAEEFTYAPLAPLARALRMPIAPVAMDDGGIDPDAAAAAVRRARRRAFFVIPNQSNPTTATLDAGRRQALVATARRLDARIVEDDVFALLADRPVPALATMAPERVYYVSSFAKSVAPGLRMGFVRAPDRASADAVASAIGLSTRMAPPLYAELACQWLVDGTLERIVRAHRAELERRVAVARRVLGPLEPRAARFGPHLWLKLPEGRGEASVIDAAARAGVLVLGSAQFSLRGAPCDALRLTLTAPRSQDQLLAGLRLVRDLVRDG